MSRPDRPSGLAKSLLIIASPLLVLYSLIYVLVGSRYSWREWVALPMADPGGFGLFTVIALLLTVALAVDQWRKQRKRRPQIRDIAKKYLTRSCGHAHSRQFTFT